MEGDGKKLALAVRMIETGSKFLGRTCADCIAFMWGEGGVEGTSRSIGRKKFKSLQACRNAGAVPTTRINGMALPCHECPKVREGAPRPSYYYADEVTDQSWLAIQHFDECDAVQQFPNDPIVKKNAAVIRRVKAECARSSQSSNLAHVLAILTAVGKGS